MLLDGINYPKTVQRKKLVFNGQQLELLGIRAGLLLLLIVALTLCYMVAKGQLDSGQGLKDVFVSIGFSAVTLAFWLYTRHVLLNRVKLREVQISGSRSELRNKIAMAAGELDWTPAKITRAYMIFQTKFSYTKEKQTITIVIFPDDKVYFNSIHAPNDYLKPAWFDAHYLELQKALKQMETAQPGAYNLPVDDALF